MIWNQFWTMSGNLQHYRKGFLATLSILHSRFTWDYTEGNHFFFDHRVLDSFPNTEQKDISPLAESFQQACQDGILRVQRSYLRGEKQFFECFETLAKIFLPLARKVICRIVRTAVFALREISWWGFDSDKILSFFIFGH